MGECKRGASRTSSQLSSLVRPNRSFSFGQFTLALALALAALLAPPPASAAPIPQDLPARVWFEACTSAEDLDCIEALGIVRPDGAFVPGRPTGFSRPNTARGSRELGKSGIFNGDGVHLNATWELPGLKNEYGTEYVISEIGLETGSAQWYDYPSDTVFPASGIAASAVAILPVPTREGFANGLWGVPLTDFPHECVTQSYDAPMRCQREANLDPDQMIRAVVRYSWFRASSVVSHLRDNVYLVEPIPTGGTRVTVEGRPGERPYFMDSLALPRNYFERKQGDALFYGWRIHSTESPDTFTDSRCLKSGTPIMTGNMFSASTPSWDPVNSELSVNVWAPHFDPSGKPYRGHYEGNFPNDYISCMWGLRESDVLNRFSVSVTEPETGRPSVATMSIQKTPMGVRIVAADFTYSTERITFKVKPAPEPAPSRVVSTSKRKVTCVKAGKKRTFVRTSSRCPQGWRRP